MSCDDVVGGLEELNIGENAPKESKELDKKNESQEQHALGRDNDDRAHVDHQQVHGDLPRVWNFLKDHPKDYIIGETSKGVSTQNQHKLLDSNLAFLS